MFVDLIVVDGIGGIFYLLYELANSFIGCLGHDEKLNEKDKDWNNEVDEEEFMRCKSPFAPLVQHSIQEENGA